MDRIFLKNENLRQKCIERDYVLEEILHEVYSEK